MVVVPRALRTLGLGALLAALVSGCGTRDGGPAFHLTAANAPNGVELHIAPPAAASPPPASSADVQAAADGNSEFAFALYRELIDGDENLVFSPYSISTALAMVYAGAAGKTATEMETVLHLPVEGEALHSAMGGLEAALPKSAGDPRALEKRRQGRKTKGGHELLIANALWPDSTIDVKDGFLRTLRTHYGAGVAALDIVGDPEGSRTIINHWVGERTQGRIPELLRPGALTRSDPIFLVVTDAVYFAATWEHEFDEHGTHDRDFHTLDGGTVRALTMEQTAPLRYAKGDIDGIPCEAVSLRYSHSDLSMVILLPPIEEFEDQEKAVNAEDVSTLIDAMTERNVELTLPSFLFRTPTTELKASLQRLGMITAFDRHAADLSGMSDGELWIDDVLHQAVVGVDEHGTEAAAATAAPIAGAAVAKPDPDLVRFHAAHYNAAAKTPDDAIEIEFVAATDDADEPAES